nr:MAG TPA: hypothetical protein [Caudoviricetes sp.]
MVVVRTVLLRACEIFVAFRFDHANVSLVAFRLCKRHISFCRLYPLPKTGPDSPRGGGISFRPDQRLFPPMRHRRSSSPATHRRRYDIRSGSARSVRTDRPYDNPRGAPDALCPSPHAAGAG